MLNILQRAYGKDNFSKLYKTIGSVELKIDVDLVMCDIKKFIQLGLSTRNKVNKDNYKILVDKLEKLLKLVSTDNCLRLNWNMSRGKFYTEPIELYSDIVYGFDMCNYIKVDDEHQICVIDTDTMANLIAFEYVAYDLGETHESIEEMLKNEHVIGVNDPEVIKNYFSDDVCGPYLLSKSLRAEKCFYISDGKINSYFCDKEFSGKSVREPVAHSCKYANFIIADAILGEHKDKKDMYILSVGENKITALIKKGTKEIFSDDVAVRVFGRMFRATPEIKIY